MATLNTTNIKHASSGSNNIVLAADGSTTISNLSGAGKLLQIVQGFKCCFFRKCGIKGNSNTGIQVSITPSSASSKILIIATISGGASAAINNWAMTLQKKTGSDLLQI